MYLININNSYHYEMENLIRVFLPDVKILRAEEPTNDEDYCLLTLEVNKISIELSLQGKIYKSQGKFCLGCRTSGESIESYLERKMAVMLYDMLRNQRSHFYNMEYRSIDCY